MNIYKFISWFVSNVGGTIAIIMALWKVYKYFSTRIKSEVTFLFHPESSEEGMPTFFKISVTNLSNHPISILDIKLGNNEMEESKIINTSRDKAFITLKKYTGYSYPLFTDSLPITIPARSSVPLLLEALNSPDFNDLDTIIFRTERKTIKKTISSELTRRINLYQLR
ncbi:hypothetical protein [Melissococcus plutonius]|uniref:hypothetical protein n=3 Tax=Melissococcus plutonius TaxID=33970 RepID=UPI0021E59710|nr:hypothetical protein [Melissococcus plutonius]MCV2505871.1 hypothetical protein [Melissococcus plutonius]